MQKIDLPATPQSSKPPRAPGIDLEALQETSSPEATIKEIAVTALSWENPLLSGILSAAGLFVAIAGDYTLQGKHGVPLLSGRDLQAAKHTHWSLYAKPKQRGGKLFKGFHHTEHKWLPSH